MAKKGQNWYGLPCNHPSHHRMARILRVFTPDKPVSVWEMVVADLGREKALSLPKRKARHLTERTIAAAERCGFIRRLPVRMKPLLDEPINKGRFKRALSYVITLEGQLFVERLDKYVRNIAIFGAETPLKVKKTKRSFFRARTRPLGDREGLDTFQ